MDQNSKDILDSLAFIKQKLDELPTKDEIATKADLAKFATKDDVRTIVREEINALVPGIVALEVKDIRADLKEIRKDIAALQERVAAHAGYAKEIDHALERIARIEKHLGLDKRVAA